MTMRNRTINTRELCKSLTTFTGQPPSHKKILSFNKKNITPNNIDEQILKAMRERNFIFITAQPDTIYFHWQIELYLYQFSTKGILDMCYTVVGYTGDTPSLYIKNLMKKYPNNIICYRDTRINTKYVPAIRPHLLKKFFTDFPHLGQTVFYHDSDIFLIKLPRFDLMIRPYDNISYLSDTVSYIGYDYINECSQRYKEKHPQLPELDIFYGMCKIVNISPQIVISNQSNSGGAQYLFKNIDADYWDECEHISNTMYDYLCEYEKKYPIDQHIQKWTAGMWVELWCYWKRGKKTIIHKELDFSWATGTVYDYKTKNIFHLAGITSDNCDDKFYKAKYNTTNIFEAYLRDPTIFDNINPANATYEYVKVIKQYVNNVYIKERDISKVLNDTITKFKIIGSAPYCEVYHIDINVICCDKFIWRSESNQYIIFYAGSYWVLTYAQCENEIGYNCGGIISTSETLPYNGGWNDESITDILY
jgi:hypothetical protein